MKKTIVVYNPSRFDNDIWLPIFWAQAKTYYEKHSKYSDSWEWYPCYADVWGNNIENVKTVLQDSNPDVFAISLYVWNYRVGHEIAAWVRDRFPNCLIVSGGPHQYYKHDINWFHNNPHLDASLPSDSYGEICLTEILDQLSVNNSVNWDLVSDIYYPKGRNRIPIQSKLTGSRQTKKSFDYAWSALTSQSCYLKSYIKYTKQVQPKARILSIIETTRGCPYGCTYCDWGGGINTAVIQRPMDFVKQDIDSLCQLGVTFVYFADANFGIFGDRDVAIIKYLATQRKMLNQRFTVGYGGFAKTENKLNTIKRILEIDIQHQLSILGEVKISMQSLDKDVLKRIDRKNIDLQSYLQTAQAAAGKKKLPVYIELIYGLPGLTLDKFYQELDTFGNLNLSIQWYPWILLPEAPAYDINYRLKEGIGTIIKDASWWAHEDDNSNNEIVIETSAYTKDNYFEMVLSSSLYKMFVQGGYFKNSLSHINMSIGQLVRVVYREFVTKTSFYMYALNQWNNQILDPKNLHKGCFVDVKGESVFLGLFLAAVAFEYHNEFTVELSRWLQKKFNIPEKFINTDLNKTVNKNNFNTKSWKGLFQHNYHKKHTVNQSSLTKFLMLFTQFHHTGEIMRSKVKFLGIVNCN